MFVTLPVWALMLIGLTMVLICAMQVGIAWLRRHGDVETARAEFGRLSRDLVRLPGRLRRVAADPRTPRNTRFWLIGLALYIASLIDPIPDFIPGLGRLDEAVLVPLILRHIKRQMPLDVWRTYFPDPQERTIPMTDSAVEPAIRPTVRAVVRDDQDRMLLLKCHDPRVAEPDSPREDLRRGDFWVLPGGGVEEGEDWESALRRELREETGIIDARIGRVLYEEHRVPSWAANLIFYQRFYAVHIGTNAISLSSLTDPEIGVIVDSRWWTVDEVEGTPETVFPDNLAQLMRSAIAGNESR